MPTPRCEQIFLAITRHYHIVSRCVRRSFLWGRDGKYSYEHRRGWIESKLAQLVDVFAVQFCGYAIMSNHYHLVVEVNTDQAAEWNDIEVARRWMQIFPGNPLAKRWVEGNSINDSEWLLLKQKLDEWRERLTNISWFIRVLNETIVCQANKEDECTGRFWEGRFKSQSLLSPEALLAAIVYVDLNPIRAKKAKTIAESDYTSGQQRFEVLQ